MEGTLERCGSHAVGLLATPYACFSPSLCALCGEFLLLGVFVPRWLSSLIAEWNPLSLTCLPISARVDA